MAATEASTAGRYELIDPPPEFRQRYGLDGPVPIRAQDAADLADGSIDTTTLCSSLKQYVVDRPEWITAFLDTCLQVATAVLGECPDSREARELLMHARHGTGDYAEALALGEALLAESGAATDPPVVICTAQALERSGRAASALRLLDRFIESHPDVAAYPSARAQLVDQLTAPRGIRTPPLGTDHVDAAAVTPAASPVADGEPSPWISWKIVAAGFLSGVAIALLVLLFVG